ncbi:hypothetical protein [Spiroplasma endosymbiont of Diplazon laetatorius]|uniref:hypothetical protein n=1 Tax=Spiroplasma endosymbiont of Diplazon laetatorius TaxID=3066322 RepID=UPI0030D1F5ED
MYYLRCKLKEIEDDFIIVESNQIGYKGYKLFKSTTKLEEEMNLFLINYKNDYINEILFFDNKETRDICEILLNIKNIGITTIKKIFVNLSHEEFKVICKEQKVEELIISTKLSETICKKVIQEVRSKLFKEKYNLKQMNVINSLNKLGYKISDIYKSIQSIDFNLNEELILERAILNLNTYEN